MTTLRERASKALDEARRERDADAEANKARLERALKAALYRQVHQALQLDANPAGGDIVEQDGQVIALLRFDDVWLGVAAWEDARNAEGNLTAWDRCEACGEWYPLGRYAYSMAALGEMLAHPASHACQVEGGPLPEQLPPVPSWQALADEAIRNLEAQIGHAEDEGATRAELLVPLGLLACARAALAAGADVAKSNYQGVI
jgi:hypothetical protein